MVAAVMKREKRTPQTPEKQIEKRSFSLFVFGWNPAPDPREQELSVSDAKD
jgi:hypothetical protein